MAEVKGVKLIKEDSFLLQNSGTIAANAEQDMFENDKTAGTNYLIKQDECVEVLKLSYNPDANSASLRFTDREKQQWNSFITADGEGANTLPFNAHRTFEEIMMDWGYKSHLSNVSAGDAICTTWKLSEGDNIIVKESADTVGIAGGVNKATLLTRRYLKGSYVDFKHFHTLHGGLGSTKKFYNDDQVLAVTVASQYVSAWSYSILKNEAFKYFNLGVKAVANLQQCKVMIDSPEYQYNEYFTNAAYNHLPYVDTSDLDTGNAGPATRTSFINTMPLLVPTVEVRKGVNKTLDVFVKDNSAPATKPRVRFVGVRYLS